MKPIFLIIVAISVTLLGCGALPLKIRKPVIGTSSSGGVHGSEAPPYVNSGDAADEEAMKKRLDELRLDGTFVIIAANVAAVYPNVTRGINYFYDDDKALLRLAAEQLEVPVCDIEPLPLSLPTYPSGMSEGLRVDEALLEFCRSKREQASE